MPFPLVSQEKPGGTGAQREWNLVAHKAFGLFANPRVELQLVVTVSLVEWDHWRNGAFLPSKPSADAQSTSKLQT